MSKKLGKSADRSEYKYFFWKNLLFPFVLCLTLLLFIFMLLEFKHYKNDIENYSHELKANIKKRFTVLLREESKMLSAVSEVILDDKNLPSIVNEKKRSELYSKHKEIFQKLKNKHEITHFYFMNPKGKCILRVHKPEKHSDDINRFTLHESMRTGKIASGIELGPLGFFTLRSVRPIYQNKTIMGYIELGKEIEGIIEDIIDDYNLDMALILEKKYLNKTLFTKSMKAFDRKSNWNLIPNNVIAFQSRDKIPEKILKILKTDTEKEITINFKLDDKNIFLINFPAIDAYGKKVGTFFMWLDNTKIVKLSKNIVIGEGTIVSLILLTIFFLLYLLSKRLDIVLSRHKKTLNLRLTYEKLLNVISLFAAQEQDLSVFQSQCIKSMGEVLDVSRIYIFEYDKVKKTMSNTFEWCKKGTSEVKENLQNLPISDYNWYHEQMINNKIINFYNTDDIPDSFFRSAIQTQSISSILAIPFRVKGEYYGFIGFDTCNLYKTWKEEDVNLLSSISRILSTYIEKKLVNQEKEKIYEELIQSSKLASVGELAAGVAHEINNPLAIAIGFTEILSKRLEEKSQLDENIESLLERQKKAHLRIENIVKGLKIFSRSESDVLERVNMHEALNDSISLINSIYSKENVKIKTFLNATEINVHANSGKIGQVIINLLSNSRDALIPNGGEIKVETKNDENDLILKISDNGKGIKKENLDRIFDSFYTTKDVGKGTGLGLSISYAIINSFGGKIEVSSKENFGTTFTIRLKKN